MTTLAARVLEAIEAAEAHETDKQHVRSKPACPTCSAEPETYALAEDVEPSPSPVMVRNQPCGHVVAFEDIIWKPDVVPYGDAAVLRRCAADRKTIEQWEKDNRPWQHLSDAEKHEMAVHPDYEYTKTEGPRKAWDDEAVPPEGDGWERNIERGRDGWERFDYHEESYWRRLRPSGPGVYPVTVPYWIANLAEAYGVPLEQEET